MNRSNRIVTGPAESLSNFPDQDGKARLAYEGVRPQPIMNLLLGQRARPILNEQAEQVESLRRDMDSLSMNAELTRIAVYDYFPAVVSHPPVT